jgi:hypothetical protein
MDTLLTLVIALGGIATGIGAIWTAMLGRRQLNEQRRFLGAQNDRARLTLEFDLLTRLADRFESPHFLGRRRSAAEHVMDTFFAEDGTVEAGASTAPPTTWPTSSKRSATSTGAGCSAPNRCGIPSACPLGCTGPCMGRPSARCEKIRAIPPCTKISSD